MPVIGIPVDMLRERIETSLSSEELVTKLQQLGCDVEGYATLRRFACQDCDWLMEITETENPPVSCAACGRDFKEFPDRRLERGTIEVLRMELLAVRPDMFDPAGLARTLRGYLGEKIGPVEYHLEEAQVTVTAEKALASPESPDYRPIRCAVVRGVELNEDRIKVLMKLQENLHWAMGRDRKRASIGVYDLNSFDSIQGVKYRLVEPEGVQFVPLGKAEGMTPKQVLSDHPKGPPYAHLLEGRERYPLLSACRPDGSEVVMAFIPIINSEDTKVKHETKELFVDVTGLESRLVEKILNMIVTSLLELCPGSTAEQVNIEWDGQEQPVVTPDFSYQSVEFDAALPLARLGLTDEDLFPESPEVVTTGQRTHKVKALLERMGHGVEVRSDSGLLVKVPSYRNDILHPMDLVEDVAIAFGYHNIRPSLVPTFTVGVETPRSALMNRVREALAGQGFLEILSLILSSEDCQYEKLGRPNRESHVSLAHPISHEQTMVRTSLIPGLLETFSVNTDHPLPQKIFEVGRISLLDSESEVGAREHLRAAAAQLGSRSDLATIKAAAEALLTDLGFPSARQVRALQESDDAYQTFLPGRGAVIGDGTRDWIWFGELHPQVLENFGLTYPVALCEVDLEALL